MKNIGSNNSDNKKLVKSWLSILCNEIGSRAVGSANNRKAGRYINDLFAQFGLSVENQSFECIDWEQGNLKLQLNNNEIPARVSPFSLPVTISGEFEYIETINQLQSRVLKDKVAVLGGELTKEPLMPKNFKFWNPEHHQKIIKMLEDKSPKAIITLSFSKDHALPVIEDGDFDLPSVVVAGKYTEDFKNATPKAVTLSFEAARISSEGANVIARINGQATNRMVVCAHFDTKAGTPGALDNASGVATILLTARLLSGQTLKRCVEFVAFNGEDYYSTPGQIAYLNKYAEQFGQVEMAINCDGVAYKAGKTGISPMACPKHIEEHVAKHIVNHKSLTLSSPWYQGDHMLFVGSGIPALAITSQNIFEMMDTVIHSEKDTIELIDIQKIVDTSAFIVEVLMKL